MAVVESASNERMLVERWRRWGGRTRRARTHDVPCDLDRDKTAGVAQWPQRKHVVSGRKRLLNGQGGKRIASFKNSHAGHRTQQSEV